MRIITWCNWNVKFDNDSSTLIWWVTVNASLSVFKRAWYMKGWRISACQSNCWVTGIDYKTTSTSYRWNTCRHLCCDVVKVSFSPLSFSNWEKVHCCFPYQTQLHIHKRPPECCLMQSQPLCSRDGVPEVKKRPKYVSKCLGVTTLVPSSGTSNTFKIYKIK